MSHRFMTALSVAAVLVLSIGGQAGASARPGAQAGVQAASPELSTTSRLQDRREVAAGTRAYSIGFEDGRFYANGWHITGEMGGVWAPPLKLVDGVWFGLDDQWVGPATKFSSGWGYSRFDLPDTAGLKLERTDFAPDGRRGALFGLKITNPGAARNVKLSVDAHSELMGHYPWGFAGVTPNASDNIADKGSFDDQSLVFTDDGALPGAPEHHYAALVGTALKPDSGAIGDQFWGPQPGHRCTGDEPGAPADPKPSQCDDGPFGRGTGGELTYTLSLPAADSKTVWLAVAGSDKGLASARQELTRALQDPDAQLAAKMASREGLSRMTRLSLPGDPLVQDSIEWGKQNIADLTQSAENLQIRWTNQGKQFPAPLGTVPEATWIGAGFPDYPWIFGTDAEYTAFAAVSVGQFEAIEGHLRALRDISDILNEGSGVVAHEAVADGSIWFGHDSRHTNPDGSIAYDFNTDETVKFPSTVALLWRWTGDNHFRDEMYDFAVRNLRYVVRTLDADHDGWPEGLGNVERSGMGPEKLDNTVYFIRGLYDLADMARSKNDGATFDWAMELAHELQQHFDRAWWFQAAQQYADSLNDPGDQQSFQKHWIGQTPMEAELRVRGRTVPGLAPFDHGNTALAGREDSCYSGDHPLNPGLFHTGCGGGANGQGEARHGWDARRAAGSDAGDLPVAGLWREHRPLLDVSLDVHAGVGQLRHRVGRRAPVAGRAARPRPRACRVRPAGAAGPDLGAGTGHPARWRVRRRAGLARRGLLPHGDRHHRGRGRRRDRHRSHPPPRLAAHGRGARRADGAQLPGPPDQPRDRGDGANDRGAPHADGHGLSCLA